MKFFSSSVLTFGLIGSSFFASGAVIPVESRDVAPAPIEKRTVDLSTAISIVSTLFADVKEYTGSINATTAGLPETPSIVESAAAAAAVNDAVTQITLLINGAIAEINGATRKDKRDVIVARQSPNALALLIVNLLLDISGALNNVIAALGLSAFLSSVLGGLVAALSALLLALVPVVNNLLELVRQILDSLLIGLSLALAGLII